MSADLQLVHAAEALDFPLSEPIKIGGNYSPVVRDGDLIYVSGQIPRIGDSIAVIGCAGREVTFEQAAFGTKICTLRALILVQRLTGSLGSVVCVPRMNVFIRSAPNFTQHSEVADAASSLLVGVLGKFSAHTRTSVGASQLPKGATVEIDFIFKVTDRASGA